jgi:hypothetical protein
MPRTAWPTSLSDRLERERERARVRGVGECAFEWTEQCRSDIRHPKVSGRHSKVSGRHPKVSGTHSKVSGKHSESLGQAFESLGQAHPESLGQASRKSM